MEIDEVLFNRLMREANSRSVSIDQLALEIIERYFQNQDRLNSADDDEFQKAMIASFRENAEIYHRLAK